MIEFKNNLLYSHLCVLVFLQTLSYAVQEKTNKRATFEVQRSPDGDIIRIVDGDVTCNDIYGAEKYEDNCKCLETPNFNVFLNNTYGCYHYKSFCQHIGCAERFAFSFNKKIKKFFINEKDFSEFESEIGYSDIIYNEGGKVKGTIYVWNRNNWKVISKVTDIIFFWMENLKQFSILITSWKDLTGELVLFDTWKSDTPLTHHYFMIKVAGKYNVSNNDVGNNPVKNNADTTVIPTRKLEQSASKSIKVTSTSNVENDLVKNNVDTTVIPTRKLEQSASKSIKMTSSNNAGNDAVKNNVDKTAHNSIDDQHQSNNGTDANLLHIFIPVVASLLIVILVLVVVVIFVIRKRKENLTKVTTNTNPAPMRTVNGQTRTFDNVNEDTSTLNTNNFNNRVHNTGYEVPPEEDYNDIRLDYMNESGIQSYSNRYDEPIDTNSMNNQYESLNYHLPPS